MKFEELLCYLERTTKPRRGRPTGKPAKVKKLMQGGLTEEQIEKYRQKLNDQNYMSNAIEKIADKVLKNVVGGIV